MIRGFVRPLGNVMHDAKICKEKKAQNICNIFSLGLQLFVLMVPAFKNHNCPCKTKQHSRLYGIGCFIEPNLSKPVFLLPHLARWSLEMSSHSCHIYQIWIGILLKMTPVNCIISTLWPFTTSTTTSPLFYPTFSSLWHHLPFLTPLKVYHPKESM